MHRSPYWLVNALEKMTITEYLYFGSSSMWTTWT